MKKLTEQDFADIVGTTNNGYVIQKVRHKGGKFSDSDCYGIALAVNAVGAWVTWEFKIDGDIDYYWGHYFPDEELAVADYNTRN